MGQFSWLDCITREQIIDDLCRDVYLLIPKEFGGGHIKEACYDGYGHFGNQDVYDLIADWNKAYIPKMLELSDKGEWICNISDFDRRNLRNFHLELPFLPYPNTCIDCLFEKRTVGILMACYNEDNARLPFPIKITHDPNATYEKCKPSLSDPNQGWTQSHLEYDEHDENDSTEDEIFFDSDIEDDDARMDAFYQELLWNILKKHRGHHIEIATYGDWNNPASITLEDMDTNEVILDASIYTICGREDV